ncbi:transglutaminase family protein [Phenylobacterium sp.]|jgi:transglutaminase-like putative cysteine protease|uniref:transglutaminase family protein n=1 Tax=Phenylobacterium sp. TaxID=1871053 RepID=UPI002E30CFC1|nr:transglutaminase family protein [Phenylobacterium sp.]HEX3364896.1 transglutaminase family protein [Phenylobacterium sp.]
MPLVSIRHLTTYRYRNPVALGEHRMMLRPLESYDQRLVSAELAVWPQPAVLRNVHDVFGNCVSIARFTGRAERLSVESRVTLEHTPQPAFDFDGESYAQTLPLAYSEEDHPDLAQSIERQHSDPTGELEAWARRFVRRAGATSLRTLLTDMTHAIHGEFAYGTRLTGAPQAPLETLALGSGSCRDFAMLMIEAVRSLGLAARFVSGYVYSSSKSGGSQKAGRTGGGHTHAWVRVYLPSCGWVEFDPTNGIVGNADLVRVAIARDPRQAAPLHGTWSGLPADYLGMDVEVEVSVEAEADTQPAPLRRVAQGY